MTARLDAIGSDSHEAALLPAVNGDDPLAFFPPEPEQAGKGSGDSAAPRMDAIPSQAPLVPFAKPNVNDGELRTVGVINRLKRVFRALDIAREIEKTVDNRLAALRGLDQEVQDRATRLEGLNQEISVGAAHADDILRAIGSFEEPLADLKRHKEDLQAIETTVAAFEHRAQNVSTSPGGDVAAWEARKSALVDALEQLGRRAADTIDDLEGRVGDFQARAHIAEQTITRLHDVSSRTLPLLQERTDEAEEQHQSLGRLITEAVRMATSLTALEERLPAIGQCDRDLARIEVAVPQIARQLEDLNASAELQRQALAVHQQRVRQTLDESQKTAAIVSELEGRIVDLSGSHQHLARFENCVAQLEQRAAAAVGESTQAAHTRNDLEQKLAVLQTQLRSMAETAQRTTAIVSGLETRIAEIRSTHRELDVAERHVEQLEQRAAAAAGEIRHATRAKDELQRDIAKCHQQIERLTMAAQGEAEKRNQLRRHSEYQEANRASKRSARDLLNTLWFRGTGPNTSRAFAPTRLIFGGAALALSAAIVLLVGTVWRISPADNAGLGRPLRPPVLASLAPTLAPTVAVAPPMQLTADSSHDRPEAARPAPAVPAVSVQRVVLPGPPLATRGVPTATVRAQSVRKDEKTPRFVGTLLIESDPAGAAAFVNQESVGGTPVLLKDLRAGSYVVRLEYEGYQRWSTAATVSAVRQGRVTAKLERERSR